MIYWSATILLSLFIFFLTDRLVPVDIRLKKSSNYGKILLNQVISLRIQNDSIDFVEYRYFTKLLYLLIKARRKYGANISEIIRELKIAIGKDIRIEKKIQNIFISLAAQQLGVCIIALILKIVFVFQFNTNFNIKVYSAFIIFQLIGFLLGVWFVNIYRAFRFSHWEKYVCCIYTIRTLISANMSLSKIYQDSGYDNLNKKGEFKLYFSSITQILNSIKYSNTSLIEDMEIISKEIWDFGEVKLDQLLSFSTSIKILVLTTFGLGGYLLIFASLFIDMGLIN